MAVVPVDLYEGDAINPVAANQLLTGIVSYSSNVRLLSSPPPAVGDEDLTDPDHVHVFLEKVVTLASGSGAGHGRGDPGGIEDTQATFSTTIHRGPRAASWIRALFVSMMRSSESST